MKIIHLTVTRALTKGQAKQLQHEHMASKKMEGIEWRTIALHTIDETNCFTYRIPWFFKFFILRGLYGWILALRLSRSCDYLILRHMTFDPFVFLFSPFIKNRISMHHAKEIEELLLIKTDWRGRAASKFEKYSGRFSIGQTVAIGAVTEEIGLYERDRCAADKNVLIYPNGINVSDVKVAGDFRQEGVINAVFVCGKFSDWHGLDKLIETVKQLDIDDCLVSLKVHLIGSLSDAQVDTISSDPVCQQVFVIHGVLDENQYFPILSTCDFAFTSLALERKGLREASTLKVREMLAMGIPVFSGHLDVALDRDFEWCFISERIDLKDIMSFGLSCKSISRNVVREGSVKSIDKAVLMRGFVEQIRDITSI